MSQRPKRRSRIVRGSFQLRLAGSFVLLAGTALVLQFLLLTFRLVSELTKLEGPGGELAKEIPFVLLQVFAFSALFLVPIVFATAILLTFRVAGPVHRIKTYLRDLAEGVATEPCRIREEDQLHELCDLLNRATESVRARNAARTAESEGEDEGASDDAIHLRAVG